MYMYENKLLFLNPLGRSRYVFIWKIVILDISSVLCASRFKYLWGMQVDSYFIMGSYIFSMTLTLADLQGNII